MIERGQSRNQHQPMVGHSPTIGWLRSSLAVALGLSCLPSMAQILASRTSGCGDIVVNFRPQQPFDPANTYLWNLGRGPASSQYAPVGVYPTEGVYPVSLVITLPSGAKSTYLDTIRVYPKPDVRFIADDTAGCFPHHVGFQDFTVPGAGTIVSRSWFFGDGTTLAGSAAPRHIYRNFSNLYTVTLRVVQSVCPLDTFSLTRTGYIRIFEGVKPNFDIPPASTCSLPVELTLANRSSSGPRQTLTYQWIINGGTPAVSTAKDPVIRYTATGSFPARLVVRSDSGCVDSIEKPIIVTSPSVRSDFRSNYDTVCQGVLVDFVNLSSPSPDTSFWTFGSDPPVTGFNQFKIFQSAGDIRVRLLNRFGPCTDTIAKTIHVLAAPQISINSPNRFGCRAPQQVDFTYTGATASTLTRLEWDFGDGTSITTPSPTVSHTYTRAGSYPLALTVFNRFGCSIRKIIDSFVVIQPPRVIPVKLVDSGCVNLIFKPRIDIVAPDGVLSQSWTFGEGAPPQDSPSPSYTYTQARNAPYPVKVRVTTRGGCVDSASGFVLIGLPPGTADFSGLPLTMCAGDTIIFKDLSTPANPVTGWFWQFGDGGSARSPNPGYVYQDTGRFTVRYTLFNNGCPSPVASKIDYVRITGVLAKYIYRPDCTDRQLVRFVNTSFNGDTFEWDFGDGSPKWYGRDPAPHRFPRYGNFLVTLKATSGSCTMSHTLIVNVLRDTIRYTTRSALSSSPCRDAAIIFTASNSNPDLIRKYEWDFGDGNFQERNATTSFIFLSNGTYRTRLRTTDVYGCTDTVVGQPLVIGGPVVGFHAPVRQGCQGLEVQFLDTTRLDTSMLIVSRFWSFGDGTTLNADPSARTVTRRYADTGSYQVKLVVRDSKGCADSMVINGYVTITKARAGFKAPDRRSCPGSPVSFINESQLRGGVFSWDFGDGGRSAEDNPKYAYAKPGLYSVILSVRDFAGCQASDTQKAYILVDTPDASFALSDTFSRCPPLSPRFDFKGKYASDFSWTFGDGNRSSLSNPNQIFLYPGNYLTTLVVTSPGGCRDTATQKIRILGPMGSPSLTNTVGCDTVRTTFRVLNALDVDSVIWDFDDGAAVTKTLSISHEYVRPNFYSPRIILKNSEGCKVSLPLWDTIKTFGIVPGIKISNTLFCDRATVSFSDTSRIVGNLKDRNWDFGNGVRSSLANPVIPYPTPGLYGVSLQITTREGCSGSLALPGVIRVVRTPRAAIIGDSSLCVDRSIRFQGLETTQPRDTSELRWSWSFGNGQTSSSPSPPEQTYPRPGRYSLRLLLRNSSGCTDTLLRSIRVDSIPDVVLPPDTTVCLGQNLVLMASGATTYRWLPPARGINCTTCSGTIALPDSTTTYIVQGTNSFGCVGKDSIRVQVIRPGIVTTSTHDTMCVGGSVQLKAGGMEFYTWSPSFGLSDPNIANPVARPSATTVYTVTGFDRKNCFRSFGTTRVMVYNYPSVFAGPDVSIRSGWNTQFKPVTSPDVTAFQWTPPTGLSCTGCPNPVASPRITSTYKLTASNPGGCISSDEVKVIVVCEVDNIFLPNTFSPNGDGMNEIFYPRGTGVRSIRSLRIFNRWGEVVFQRQNVNVNDPGSGWDGRYKGRLLPPDVYVYVIDVICENQGMVSRKGDVALIR